MTTFRLRRQRSIAMLLLLVVGLYLGHLALQIAFYPLAILTGGLLFVVVLLLTLFNARKKLPFMPLLKASAWMQFHAYAGWLSVFLFLLHIDWKWPQGTLEQFVGAIFVIVAGSGVLGLILSRTLPPRLTRSGEPIIFERIPGLLRRLQEHANELVVEAEETTGSTTLADFHENHMGPYLASRASWVSFLADKDLRHDKVRSEFKSIERYLNADESVIAAEMAEVIETKRHLDFQYSGQRLLKAWLFVHIPLTYSLIILAVVHACIALSYTASIW